MTSVKKNTKIEVIIVVKTFNLKITTSVITYPKMNSNLKFTQLTISKKNDSYLVNRPIILLVYPPLKTFS